MMTENRQPKISVCIPTYNGANKLSGAVDSVAKQTFRDYEIVIVDNDSRDDTEAIAKDLRTKYGERVRCFRNPRNIGAAANFNQSVLRARGEYIKFLCVDDLLLPQSLGVCAAALDAYSSVTLVTGRRRMIDETGHLLDTRGYSAKDRLVDGPVAITRCLFGSNSIGEPSAVMFRKQDWLRLGSGFKQSMPQLMDMELWFRLLEIGNLFSSGEPVCAIRIHGAQLTWANMKSGMLVRDNIAVASEYVGKPYLHPTRRQRIQKRVMMTYRIWRSRGAFEAAERHAILGAHGYRLAYPLMSFAPLAARAAVLWRRLKG